MELIHGFPLFDNIMEAIEVNIISENVLDSMHSDMELDYMLDVANKIMIYTMIKNHHIPTILEYLDISGEKVELIELAMSIYYNPEIDIFEYISSNPIIKKGYPSLPVILHYLTTQPHIFLSFPEGIKSKTLSNILQPHFFNENEGDIKIQLFPSKNYKFITTLISQIFKYL